MFSIPDNALHLIWGVICKLFWAHCGFVDPLKENEILADIIKSFKSERAGLPGGKEKFEYK